MITKGQLKAQILRMLNKTSKYKGAYTDEKLDDAIEDCMDYLSVEQGMANEGWRTKIQTFTTIDSQISVEIPSDYMLINQVRYRVGDEFIPLVYDQDREYPQAAGDSAYTQFPSRYRIVDNAIYFNPALAQGGTDYLQVEYTSYPHLAKNDLDTIPGEFDKAMGHFIKFRAASYLASSVGKVQKEWVAFETQWYNQVLKIINKRNNVTQRIRDFEG